jgi:hypothetical protein
MSKDQTGDLLKFLAPFPDHIRETALWLRSYVWDLYPTANELIYDSYNGVSLGWSITEKLGQTFCGIAVFRSNYHIHFNFFYGSSLSDPDKILLGEGSRYRYLLVPTQKDFPKTYIKKLIKQAYALSLEMVESPVQGIQGASITKAIYKKKRAHTVKKKKSV